MPPEIRTDPETLGRAAAAAAQSGGRPSLIDEPPVDTFGTRYGRGTDGRIQSPTLAGPAARVDVAFTLALARSRLLLDETVQGLTAQASNFWHGEAAALMALLTIDSDGSPA